MKRLILFLCSFVIAVAFAALLYFAFAPGHQALRDALKSPSRADRQVAAAQAVQFEKLHLRALLLNDAQAQFMLGQYYKVGNMGPREDSAKAVYWTRRAALQGHAEACLAMARFSLLGYGVEKDEKAAAGWVERAAEHGSSPAAGMMGMLYLGGLGVEQDFAKARHWLAQSNDPNAVELAFKLQTLASALDKLPPEEKARREKDNFAAAQQDIRAAFNRMLDAAEKALQDLRNREK